MSAPNTTPGPWVAKGGRVETAEPSTSVAATIESFVTGIHGTRSISRKEARANAHLIAAAPELYEALERMLSKHCNDTGTAASDWKPDSAPFLALVALRKARGETE